MATRTLTETAGILLVEAARRGDRADDVFREVTRIFGYWHADPPVDLYRRTKLIGSLTPDEQRDLVARWQRAWEQLLEFVPDAEPHLEVLIAFLQSVTAAAPAEQVTPPAPRSEPDVAFTERAVPFERAAPEPTDTDEPPAAGEPPDSDVFPDAPYERDDVQFAGPPAEISVDAVPVAPPAPAPPAIPESTNAVTQVVAAAPPAPAPPATAPYASGVLDPVSEAIQSAVRPGLLAFNPPDEMTQGRAERVEVGIARSAELVDALVTGLHGRGQVRIEELPTSAFMSAELRGDSFVIKALSPAEQIVAAAARWEFDVTPRHAGVQRLTLCISMRFAETAPLAVPGSRIAVPVVERQIRIRVNVGYGTRAFVGQNWQWLVGTAVAVAGALAAFLAVVH